MMIKVKCDICGKDDLNINSLILINKKIDYCNDPKCIRKVTKIKEELKRELEAQKNMLYAVMRRKQNQLLKKLN